MEEIFNVRFNIQKCGVDCGDNSAMLSEAFHVSEDDVKKYISEINYHLKQKSDELKNRFGSEITDKKILFAGDSLTSDRFSFMNILKTMGISCVDCAISGSPSTTHVEGFERNLELHKPDIVHLLIGTNDLPLMGKDKRINVVSPCEYEKNIRYILSAAKEKNIAVIVSLLPLIDEEAERYETVKFLTNAQVEIYNKNLISATEDFDVIINDINKVGSSLDIKQRFREDGVHFSPDFHFLIAEELIRILKKENF